MTLATFIEREVDNIVAEWEEFARTSIPPARNLSPEDLRDHARVLLLAIVADLQSPETADDRHDKSRGELPRRSPRITEMAEAHSRHRFEQGFTLDQMVSEPRALRASVLRRWLDQQAVYDRNAVDELIRFGAAMDQALTAAVSWFSGKIDQSRGLLLGVLGHDLRTPLSAVRLSAQYLQRSNGLDGGQSKAVLRILNSSDSIRTMVDDILDFTHTALGVSLPIVRADCDLGEVCEEAVGELAAIHPEREIRLERTGDLAGLWDAARIRQLVSNLVGNAIQHGNARTPVTVMVAGHPEEVTVQVHNEARPIPHQSLRTLFEPLAHTGAAAGERHSGSSGLGLGLYIAREIALAHGGQIDVASSAQEGTKFTARLHR